MLSQEENELLTRVGLGTPMGDLMRQHWLPMLYSWELASDGPPLRVRLLGEDLVAWRDSDGRPGLLRAACAHRGASLFFGRNEERGLRCVYHGWKYDVDGNCVDMPNEPAESNFKNKIRGMAYRTADWGGVVFAYLGPRQADPPGLPRFEWAILPEAQRHHEYKAILDCNWLQALEGDIDTSHLYFLHSRIDPGDATTWGVHHRDRSPRLEITETEPGLLYGARRLEADGNCYWRTTHFLMPIFTLFPATEDGLVPSHIYTPIDDEHTMHWGVRWHPARELPDHELVSARGQMAGMGPMQEEQHGKFFAHWWPVANRENDFLLDRELQRTKTFTGIPTVRLQDAAMTASMGPISDRSREHLGTTDAMIIRTRLKLLLAAKALRQKGITPPAVDHPELYMTRSCSAVLPPDVDWQSALGDWHFARTKERPAAALTAERAYRER
jgi:nitrite reductase/ring-hydroxylating ferredoxin subunit